MRSEESGMPLEALTYASSRNPIGHRHLIGTGKVSCGKCSATREAVAFGSRERSEFEAGGELSRAGHGGCDEGHQDEELKRRGVGAKVCDSGRRSHLFPCSDEGEPLL
jgi:hypothetical protein